jgi:hypothetical protein
MAEALETTLVGTLTGANKGATWFNSTTNKMMVWDGSTAVQQSISGVSAGGDLTGTYPNPTIANDKITSAKVDNAGIGINKLVISDATTGATLKFATCGSNEVLRYEGVNGWVCRDPSTIVTLTWGDITSGAGKYMTYKPNNSACSTNDILKFDGTNWVCTTVSSLESGTGDFMKNGSVAMTGNFNAGGNSILGNTTASANLTLESTSNATKGYVNIQPNGGNVGITLSVPHFTTT